MVKHQVPSIKRASMTKASMNQTTSACPYASRLNHWPFGALNLFGIWCLMLGAAAVVSSDAAAQDKPVPKLQILPQPYDQAAFVRDDAEVARYHFGPTLRRPFVFPLVGPSGRSLTRM